LAWLYLQREIRKKLLASRKGIKGPADVMKVRYTLVHYYLNTKFAQRHHIPVTTRAKVGTLGAGGTRHSGVLYWGSDGPVF
jgi:hypothetical protein